MQLRHGLAGLAIGSMMLGGIVVSSPFPGMAQDSTPSSQTADDETNGTPVVGTPLLSPAIDFVAAQEAALAGQAGANVTGIDLNGDDGVLEYSVTLDNGYEVNIDATTGDVISTEEVDEEDGDDADESGDVDQSDDDQSGQGDNESEDDE